MHTASHRPGVLWSSIQSVRLSAHRELTAPSGNYRRGGCTIAQQKRREHDSAKSKGKIRSGSCLRRSLPHVLSTRISFPNVNRIPQREKDSPTSKGFPNVPGRQKAASKKSARFLEKINVLAASKKRLFFIYFALKNHCKTYIFFRSNKHQHILATF